MREDKTDDGQSGKQNRLRLPPKTIQNDNKSAKTVDIVPNTVVLVPNPM